MYRGITSVSCQSVDGMTLEEMIDLVEGCGFSCDAMSNDEIYELCLAIVDGHQGDSDPAELEFSSD